MQCGHTCDRLVKHAAPHALMGLLWVLRATASDTTAVSKCRVWTTATKATRMLHGCYEHGSLQHRTRPQRHNRVMPPCAAKGGSGKASGGGNKPSNKGNSSKSIKPSFPGAGSTSGSSKSKKDSKPAPTAGAGFGSQGGKARGGKSSDSGTRSSAAPPESENQVFISGPVEVELQEEITRTEFAEAPRWDTWCNHMSGEWVGVYSAYTPWAGQPEPVWMDERGKYLNTVLTRCQEERGKGLGGGSMLGGGEDDLLLRTLGRATTPAALKQLSLPSPNSQSASEPQPTVDDPASALPTATETEGVTGSGSEEEDESVEIEALSYNSQGVVVFDGGHYSAGPDYVGPPQFKMLTEGPAGAEEAQSNSAQGSTDSGGALQGSSSPADTTPLEDEEGVEGDGVTAAPTTTSIVESCLVDWGSRSRMRLKLTLRIGHQPDNDEVDVQVLRVTLFREVWVGPSEFTTHTDIDTALRKLALAPSSSAHTTAPATTSAPTPASPQTASEDSTMSKVKEALRDPCVLPRAMPEELNGSWSVFTVSATGIEENDLMTGEPIVTWIYQTNEDKQQWEVEAGIPTGDEGGAVYLPGGVIVTFSMQDLSDSADPEGAEQTPAALATSANGTGPDHSNSVRPPRGLRLGMSWVLPVGNQVLSVERDYDGQGVLRCVRYSTAVKGAWSGGRM